MSTYQIKSFKESTTPQTIEFCQLSQIESNQYISTEAYYSGVEEYWSLTSNTKCELDHQVYLNSDDIENKQLLKRLKRLHKNYWKYTLKLKIIGRVERTSSDVGFGHLGILKTQIVPYKIEILAKEKKSSFGDQQSIELESENHQEMKAQYANRSLDSLVLISIKSLSNKDLLNGAKTQFVSCYLDKKAINFKEFKLNEKKIKNSSKSEKSNVILRIESDTKAEKIIDFRSYGDGGYEYFGTIQLIKSDQKWILNGLQYITAIE